MVTAWVLSACLSWASIGCEMAERRPDPRRTPRAKKWTLADALAGLPAPPQAKVIYGQFDYPGADVGPAGGYTDVEAGNIYLRTRAKRPRRDFSLGHELFHLLDTQVLTDQDRAKFSRILKVKGPWDQGTGVAGGGMASPSEVAADYYASLATGANLPGSGRMVSSYVDGYGPKRLRRFDRALGKLMQDRGLAQLDLGSYR